MSTETNYPNSVKKILKKALLFFSKDYPNYFDSMQVKDIIEDLHF